METVCHRIARGDPTALGTRIPLLRPQVPSLLVKLLAWQGTEALTSLPPAHGRSLTLAK